MSVRVSSLQCQIAYSLVCLDSSGEEEEGEARPARAAAAVALLINSSLSVVGNKESGKIKICRADRLLRDGKPPTIL